jgi:hypothetical protein
MHSVLLQWLRRGPNYSVQQTLKQGNPESPAIHSCEVTAADNVQVLLAPALDNQLDSSSSDSEDPVSRGARRFVESLTAQRHRDSADIDTCTVDAVAVIGQHATTGPLPLSDVCKRLPLTVGHPHHKRQHAPFNSRHDGVEDVSEEPVVVTSSASSVSSCSGSSDSHPVSRKARKLIARQQDKRQCAATAGTGKTFVIKSILSHILQVLRLYTNTVGP